MVFPCECIDVNGNCRCDVYVLMVNELAMLLQVVYRAEDDGNGNVNGVVARYHADVWHPSNGVSVSWSYRSNPFHSE